MSRTAMDDLRDSLVGKLYRAECFMLDFGTSFGAILITDVQPITPASFGKSPIEAYDLTAQRNAHLQARYFIHLTPLNVRDLTAEEAYSLVLYEKRKKENEEYQKIQGEDGQQYEMLLHSQKMS